MSKSKPKIASRRKSPKTTKLEFTPLPLARCSNLDFLLNPYHEQEDLITIYNGLKDQKGICFYQSELKQLFESQIPLYEFPIEERIYLLPPYRTLISEKASEYLVKNREYKNWMLIPIEKITYGPDEFTEKEGTLYHTQPIIASSSLDPQFVYKPKAIIQYRFVYDREDDDIAFDININDQKKEIFSIDHRTNKFKAPRFFHSFYTRNIARFYYPLPRLASSIYEMLTKFKQTGQSQFIQTVENGVASVIIPI